MCQYEGQCVDECVRVTLSGSLSITVSVSVLVCM